MKGLLAEFTDSEFACLAGLVEREIINVRRHRRVLGYACCPEDQALLDAYLAQLECCLAALISTPEEVAAA